MAAIEQVKTLALSGSAGALDATPPAPLATFTTQTIHPRNIAILERQEKSRVLTKAELVQATKKLQRLTDHLEKGGYVALVSEVKPLYEAYRDETDADKRAALERKMLPYKVQIDALRPVYHEQQQLIHMLQDHYYAVQRDRLHRGLQKQMQKEADLWAQKIIECWSRLGYQHIFTKGKKTFRQTVTFERRVILPDSVWFKIAVTRKTMFGFKDNLPYHVRTTDLISDQTLLELEAATERQVTAHATKNSGAWVVVHRLSSRDGIIEHVTLEQLEATYPQADHDGFPIPLGVGENRRVDWIRLIDHPHILIGGSTGNGKSNIINAWLSTLIRHHGPDELRLVLIDLKEGGAEFGPYADIPHLMLPILSTVEDAANALDQLENFRAERMKNIARAGCKGIEQYNAKYPETKLSHVMIVVDELARIRARSKEVAVVADRAIGEITALGRAAGIQLIGSTQSPYVGILPGSTKANMAVRLAFALPHVEASRAILGNGDAFTLPDIKGRAFVAIGSQRWQIQTPECREIDLLDALQSAKKWDSPGFVELKSNVKLRVFDEQALLRVVIDYLAGNLGARVIYDAIKNDETVSRTEIQEMVKKLTQRFPGPVEFEGVQYTMYKKGTGFWLKPAESEVVESPEKADAS